MRERRARGESILIYECVVVLCFTSASICAENVVVFMCLLCK